MTCPKFIKINRIILKINKIDQNIAELNHEIDDLLEELKSLENLDTGKKVIDFFTKDGEIHYNLQNKK